MIRIVAFALLLASITPATAAHWRPPAGTTFAIILSTAPIRVETEAHAVDIDLFEAKPSTVRALTQQGKRVICYMSAGSWENWRPDKNDLPDEVIGRPIDGWPGEKYLDIRALDVLGPIMVARLELCKAKGFDAVDPDNVDAYEIGRRTGFPLTRAHAIRYMRFLAREAHRLGLAIGLKNATSISDDVLDVYLDVGRGLLAYDAGDVDGATWSWRFHFDCHWGDHAVDALRALQRACVNTASRT